MTRFRDTRQTLEDFRDEFLVRCPCCSACARVRLVDPNCTDWFAPRRFSCIDCGSSRDWAAPKIHRLPTDNPVDDFFHYPLWLQTACCGHTLWAYNLRHLALIEQFVAAKLREHRPDERLGWSNQSLFSRLPRWIQSSQNRTEILHAIDKLRHSVPLT